MPTQSTSVRTGASRQDRWLQAGCALAALCLAWFQQPFYPMTWLDEGFVLGGAMSLVREGAYGLRSSEGLRLLDEPLVANGPGVVLPIAATWKLIGMGLPQARWLMVALSSLTVWIFFGVARRVSDTRAAAVSVVLLLALPLVWMGEDAAGFLVFGRQALGNVPALCYFLIGFLSWHRGQVAGQLGPAAVGGLFFGLATVTKSQYLVLFPALLVVGALQFVTTRERRSLVALGLLLVGMAACQAAWWITQLQVVGWQDIGAHLEAIRSSSHTTVVALRPSRMPGSISYLLRSGYAGVVLPSLLFAAWRYRANDVCCRSQLLLLVICAVWTVWYAAVSVGWPRYAFEPFAIGLLLSGQAVVASREYLRRAFRRTEAANANWSTRWWVLAFFVITIATTIVAASQRVTALLAQPDRSPQEFARHLVAEVPSGAIVESWEWELDVLADLRYHHPETIWLDRYTELLQFGDSLIEHYDPRSHAAAFLINGPFSKWTGIYAAFLSDGCCVLLKSIGPYDLYRVVPSSP